MKKISILILALLVAFSPVGLTYYTPDGVDVTTTGITYEGATDDAFETRVVVTDPTADRTVTYPDADVDLTNNISTTAIDTEVELEAILTDVANVIVSTEVDTAAELDALVADENLIVATEIDTSAEIAAIVTDETGTGALCLATNPVIAGWAAQNAANQACSTTCTTGTAILGFDAGTNAFVDESSALADSCVCSIDN